VPAREVAARGRRLGVEETIGLRLAAQRLRGGPRAAGVGELLGSVFALQAQDTRASRLAVRARTTGLVAGDVRAACGQERAAVRTWAMRGTLHMVPAADAAWLTALLGERFGRRNARRRAQLGLDDATCERAVALLPELLAGGPLTRAELVAALAASGVRIGAGQAPAHLVALAAQRGVICRGPDREDEEPTYVHLPTWVPGARVLDRDQALAELARRYLAGHAPAGPADLAAWSGLPLGTARAAIAAVADAGELEPVEVVGLERTPSARGRFVGESRSAAGGAEGAPAWVPAGLAAPEPDPVQARLLGAFDAWLLGWRDRGPILPERLAKRVQAGGGWLHPVVLAGGHVVGTWRQRRAGGRIEVVVAPFERLDPALRPSLEAEAADLGRFLGVEADLRGTG
jgi:hypothetical protein